jgi:hypothetical protein
MDDDHDGHADCDDQDCWDLPACNNMYEDCYNFLDDDGDGAIDCEDPDCSMEPVCWQQSDLCNDMMGDGFITMYTQVYPENPGVCLEEGLECRIDRFGSNGVPRCVRTEPGRDSLAPCDNDLECPFGHICAWSETLSSGQEDFERAVCLPLCANNMNILCPEGLTCFNLSTVMDDSSGGEPFEVLVTACDQPFCAVFSLEFGGCMSELETCFPTEDMMGQGYCGRFGLGGPRASCESDSDCLPKHMCLVTSDGNARQCEKVCITAEDCAGVGVTNPECLKPAPLATYGFCVNASIDNL